MKIKFEIYQEIKYFKILLAIYGVSKVTKQVPEKINFYSFFLIF